MIDGGGGDDGYITQWSCRKPLPFMHLFLCKIGTLFKVGGNEVASSCGGCFPPLTTFNSLFTRIFGEKSVWFVGCSLFFRSPDDSKSLHQLCKRKLSS